MVIGFVRSIAAPYPVSVTTNAIPPANPVISQYISSGNVGGTLLYINPAGGSVQALVYGRIECLSPSPFSIALNPSFTQQGVVTLTAGVPLQLPATQLMGAFGFFNDNNLVVSGVSLTSLKDASNNIKLPPGVYRICFSVRAFDPASGMAGGDLSDPNLGCAGFTIQAGGNVIVTNMVVPPVNAAIGSSVLSGNVTPTLLYNNAGGGSTQVKVFGRLERLAPSSLNIALNAGYAQQAPVTLTAGVPLRLTPGQVMDALGGLMPGNLSVSGIGVNELRDAAGNFALPDGTYRMCFYARYVDPATGALGANASDPAGGCTTFGICASASAPQLTSPVNNFNLGSEMVTVQKVTPVVFTWTPPTSTCGGQMGLVTYDLEIRLLLQGQTVTDAINNPPVFVKRELPSTSFLLDTLLYKDVLKDGESYVIRVRAHAGAGVMVQKIDNNGYSRVEVFKYGGGGKDNGGNDGPIKLDAEGGDCGIAVPSNTSVVSASESLVGKNIKVGEFVLVPTKMTRNNDNSYTGEGTVNWNPLIGKANLKVAFDKIKINTDKAIYDGKLVTQTDPGVFKSETFSQFKDFAGKTGPALDKLSGDVEKFINNNPGVRLLSQLNGSTPVDLPLGLNNQDIGGVPVTLAIMNIVFTPKGATMTLLFNMNIPEANGWLTLAGTDFCIHPTGMSLSKGTLFLPIDRDFNIGSGSNNFNIKFKGCPSADSTNGTYVSWENNKLSDIVAHAEIAFPQDLLSPEDDKGHAVAGSVIAKIGFRFKEWEDWIATIDMPHFQLKDVKGLSFQPSVIWYDHSTKSNPSGFSYPSNAKVKKGNDFEGLYVASFKVLLPEDFKTFNQKDERTAFTATNMIIDDQGLSVLVQGKNVIDISTGNLGGWGYSLDNIEVNITGSTFTSGKIDGKFLLPVSKTPLDYSGDLHLGKDSVSYAFVIKPSEKMSWDIWKASVELKPNSYIEVKKDSAGAAVTALMNGDISFTISDGAPAVKFEAISFDSLGISNRNIKTHKKEFWMSPGTWAVAGVGKKSGGGGWVPQGPDGNDGMYDQGGSQGAVAGFPINLDKIVPFVDISTSVKAGIKLNLQMGIGGADKTIIGASTTIAVYGEADFGITTEDFRPKFKVTGGVSADSIKLYGDVGPLKVDGWLAFYKKDNTFGDGIKGHVEATFPLVKVVATAQFGNVNNYNYWFIDACAEFPTAIPVVGVVGIKGFGGGAYYNMMLQGPAPDKLVAKTAASDATPGKSMSGMSFVPNPGSFGLRATVLIALTSGAGPKAMNAKVTLGAELLNGAFKNINLTGDVYVFTNPPENDRAVVNGHVEIVYDFPTETLSLNALVNGKFATVTASIPIALHAGPDGWFFKVGDPFGDRVRIKLVDVGDDNSVLRFYLGATAYLGMGTLINPVLPDLPEEIVAAGLGRSPSVDALITSMNKADGNGMMFGARVDAHLKFNAAIFYAKGDAIIGFDMALKNFSDFTCGGQSAGWENWYAMGQLYAYLALQAGVHLDVWFYKGDISLLNIMCAGVLTAGLPNPTWLDGVVKFEGDVLGLVKFSTTTHFTLGDKCYPAADPLHDIRIISDEGPKGNKESVYTLPFAASNLGLEKTYEIAVPPTNEKPDGEIRFFRFRIRSFRLLKNGNIPVESDGLEYQQDNTAVLLKRTKILDGNTDYTGEVVCFAEQYYEGEGWAAPYDDKLRQRADVVQTETFSFHTGPKPDYIPNEAVAFSYPVNKQRYVLKQEFGGRGRIHLDGWPDNILNGDGKGLNALRSYKLFFIPVGGTDTVKGDYTWNDATLDMDYVLPAGLKNGVVYKVEFWSFPKTGGFMQAAVKTVSSMSVMNVKGVSFQQKATSVSAASINMPKPIYTMYFRTSQFNTLADKVSAMGSWSAGKVNGVLTITNDQLATEHFDDYETKGFTAPDGKISYPPLLDLDIPWDDSKENDKWASDNIYANAFLLNFKQVSTSFGSDWVRMARKPVKTFDYKGLYSDQPLNATEMGEPVPPVSTPHVSSGGGFMMRLPMSGPGKSSSVMTGLGHQSIVWTREQYLQSDFRLMKDMAYAVVLNAGAFYNWSPVKAENTLAGMGGMLDLSSNSLGGYTGIPWNKFYYLYSDAKFMTIVQQLKVQAFTDYPHGTRGIRFGYRAGTLQGNGVTTSFSY